jgi:hypothetical protein
VGRSEAGPGPCCAYCAQPGIKPFGWFTIERWENGQVVKRGFACGAGCMLAVAHFQRERDPNSTPKTTGILNPI